MYLLSLCAHIYVGSHVHMYGVCTYSCGFIYMYVSEFICIYLCGFTCMYAHEFVSTHSHEFVCTHSCMYACVFVCTHSSGFTCMNTCGEEVTVRCHSSGAIQPILLFLAKPLIWPGAHQSGKGGLPASLRHLPSQAGITKYFFVSVLGIELRP